jgi:PAS domain S-box-containing protein
MSTISAFDSAQLFAEFANHVSESFCVMSPDGTLLYVNHAFEVNTGYSSAQLLNRPGIIFELVYPEDISRVQAALKQYFLEGTPSELEFRTRTKDGRTRWVRERTRSTRDATGRIEKLFTIITDETARKAEEAEKERLIQELQATLSRVRLLSGLIPICAHCKKIRNDQGYWEQVESYIRDHSQAEFSHGLCPDCLPLFKRQGR